MPRALLIDPGTADGPSEFLTRLITRQPANSRCRRGQHQRAACPPPLDTVPFMDRPRLSSKGLPSRLVSPPGPRLCYADMGISRSARVFVAGHRGLVGSAIWRHLQQAGFSQLIGRTRAELDLLDT